MRRREFIMLLGSAAAAWPLVAGAQQPKRPLIAYLSPVARQQSIRQISAFLQGLRDLGFVEGRDFDITYRFAEGYLDRLSALAREVVDLKPSVILAAPAEAAIQVKALTDSISIVCPLLKSSISARLITSESHPGGNVTGVLFRIPGLAGKQLELALQLIPNLAKIGLLGNAASGNITEREEAQSASERLSINATTIEVSTPDDLEGAFHSFAGEHVRAVIVLVDAILFNERKRIASLAAEARLPDIYGLRDHVEAGGLISYGVDTSECFRRSAAYVHKILKGARPADLPVEFPTRLELVINLKTAKALGLTVPPTLLAIASRCRPERVRPRPCRRAERTGSALAG